MKKLIIASLSSLLILSASVNTVVAAIETDIDTEETAVETDVEQVVIYEDENKTIMAEVPAEMKDQYLKNLQNPAFVEQELTNVQQLKQARASSEPSVTYFGKEDILRRVNAIDDTRNWLEYVDNPISSGLITKAVSALTGVGLIGAIAGAVPWTADQLMAQQESWWSESLEMILSGQISAVKMTLTPNPGPGYPQMYRELERV
ncbi:hypothetical protein [Dolosigranulum pigrum]|uniref:hypothetical protein n=1 Tax=Dolosigranulum pigrum TaxID=29394 RepID=UPI001AD872A3|nr:hypothetical protein [Dolosigranulum pigrum]QTJ57142.1 hypothetical protein FE335_06335 [Dolosigranulum pigrum]